MTPGLKAAAVHWNEKPFRSITSKDIVEIPEQILKIPGLQNTTGKGLATTICETLQEWGLTETVKAICCDMTLVNL